MYMSTPQKIMNPGHIKVIIAYTLCSLISCYATADEYWNFLNITCNKEFSFFSLQTFGYYNPDHSKSLFGYTEQDQSQFEGREEFRTPYDLGISPYICDLDDFFKIRVEGYCEAGTGEVCRPGRGPAREGIAIYINDELWPLLGDVPWSENRSGWIETIPEMQQVKTHSIEISGRDWFTKSLNATHCSTDADNSTPRYGGVVMHSGVPEGTYADTTAKCIHKTIRRP